MTWKDSSIEIIIAIIGSSLIGTSLTTFYSDIYFQPFINIQVKEHRNELSPLNDVEYYEILFKNTGQKYASNLQLNMFFFANITKHIPIIYGNATFELGESIISSNFNQIKPSLLNASLPKFPKNSVIIIYVWTEPWSQDLERLSLYNSYFISATYDEGSNHVHSFKLPAPYKNNINNYFPHIPEDSSNIVGLSNIPFVTIILSMLTFAILYRIRRLRKKNALPIISTSKIQYDIPFLIPIIVVSSVLIFFVELYLNDLIFMFLPSNLIDLSNYSIPINQEIIFPDGNRSTIFPFLLYGFFGIIIILISKLLVTYTISKVILKYSINNDYNLSFKLDKAKIEDYF